MNAEMIFSIVFAVLVVSIFGFFAVGATKYMRDEESIDKKTR